MANATIDFDTPQTGSFYTVEATGTLIPFFTGYLTINVAVSNTSTSYARALTNFKKTIPISNTSIVKKPYDVTTTLTVVPQAEPRDTFKVTWGLSLTPII